MPSTPGRFVRAAPAALLLALAGALVSDEDGLKISATLTAQSTAAPPRAASVERFDSPALRRNYNGWRVRRNAPASRSLHC
jgi:hypothetical protein